MLMHKYIEKAVKFLSEKAAYLDSLPEKCVFFWITGIYFVWRILTLPTFDTSGDALWKWRFLRYFSETGVWFPLYAEHHQGRWAQNLPVYWVMELFGSQPWVGTVIPVLAGFILILLVWRIARHITSQTGALAAVFLTLSNPVFVTESAQILPSLPMTMYILLAVYLLIKYLKNPELWYFPLLAGAAVGGGWGCKVTAAYWAVGMGLFLLFYPGEKKCFFRLKKLQISSDVLLFSLGFLLIFIPETFIINDRFDVQLGRISMLHKHHGGSVVFKGFNLIEYIFSPFCVFLGFMQKFRTSGVMAGLFVLMLPLAFWHFRDKAKDTVRHFLFFTSLVALLFHCYLVLKVFPFVFPERPLVRYFLPLLCIWNILGAAYAGKIPELAGKFKKAGILTVTGIFAYLLLLSVINLVNEPIIKQNNIWCKIRAAYSMARQKKENLPVLIKYPKKREFTSRTYRAILGWKSLWGNYKDLPRFDSGQGEKNYKIWQNIEPYRNKKGDMFFHAAGKSIAPGSSGLSVIVDREKVYLKKFERQAVNSETQRKK